MCVCVCVSRSFMQLCRSQVQFCPGSDSDSALFYCCYTTTRRRRQRRRHHRQRQRRCSVRFGFGSFVRLSVTQWVERTLGLAGFLSHRCGYICMRVCVCMCMLPSRLLFFHYVVNMPLCIYCKWERERAALVMRHSCSPPRSHSAAPRALSLSLSFSLTRFRLCSEFHWRAHFSNAFFTAKITIFLGWEQQQKGHLLVLWA